MAPLQTLTQRDPEDAPNDALLIGSGQTDIQQFYHSKSVFVTGATGFLGKIIMEKLLRVCNIENIYILIRNKKGKDIHSRLDDIFDDPLFDRLKEIHPKFRHKVVAITGDCVLPGLGICPAERTILQQNVNIVFHVAATVRFDEKLKLALGINVCGTREILTLSKEIKDLKALVHVSTAYANCNRKDIDEKFYKTNLTGENALKLADCLDEKTLDAITPEIIKEWPNTYAFTKCLAEDLVRTNSKGLPIAIFRPAIVIPTYKEPVTGWIDNMYGPTGITVGVGAGLLRVLHIKKHSPAEIVPVDMCVNSLLASAWDVANNTYDEAPIYNFVTSTKNPISWQKYCDLGVLHGVKNPLPKTIWYHTFTMSSSFYLVMLLKFFYHILPALAMDGALLLIGKKPKMLQIYKKVHRFCAVITYFTSNTWNFSNKNVTNLWEKLSEADQKLFFFDMEQINWSDFIDASLLGMRTYLMKEDPKTIPSSITRMTRMKVLHYTVIYAIYSLVLYLSYKLLSTLLMSS